MWKYALIFFLATAVPATAAPGRTGAMQDDDTGVVVLTDSLPATAVPQSLREGHIETGDAAEAEAGARRAAILARLEQIVAETERRGYAVAAKGEMPAKEALTYDMNPATALENLDLAYTPSDLQHGIFSSASLAGLRPKTADDGRVHQLVYWFEFPDLGTVFVDELSYATIPGVRITVNRPAGNVFVDGIPATYTVLKSPAGNKGMTTIAFFTDSRMYTLTILDSIGRRDPRFERLLDIAHALL